MAQELSRVLPPRPAADIAATTPAEVKRVEDFTGISDANRFQLIQVLLDQTWVGPYDEAALERLWDGLDEAGLIRFTAAHPGLWRDCVDRGAELTELRVYRAIQNRFREDVTALARHYLSGNETLVHHELDALGPGEVRPGPQQTSRISAVQQVAASVARLQHAQEAARQARVGWRIGDGGEVDADWTGRQVKYQVPFQPGAPPPLTVEPEDLPYGDVLVYRIKPYEELNRRHAEASEQIGRLVGANPVLFGLARERSSAATGAFVTESDPARARKLVTEPLRKVLADIAATRTALGGDLDPLDLTPLHQQLYRGQAAVGGSTWTEGFRHQVAVDTVAEHAVHRALVRQLLQAGEQLVFAIALVTGPVLALLLVGLGTAAAGWQALDSYREAQAATAAEGTAVRPGTELVDPGSAEFARMTAEADAVAFALAVLALGATAAAAWAARPGVLSPHEQLRARFKQEGLYTAPVGQLFAEADPAIMAAVERTLDLPAAQRAPRLDALVRWARSRPPVPLNLEEGTVFGRGGTGSVAEVRGRPDLASKFGAGRASNEARAMVELELAGIPTVYVAEGRTATGAPRLILRRIDGVGSKEIIGRLSSPAADPELARVNAQYVTERTIADLENIHRKLSEVPMNVGDFQFIIRKSDGAVFVNDPVAITLGRPPSPKIRDIINRFRRVLRLRREGQAP
ncbi:hypothetical protein [Kutzneria albida]|uniref:Putative membrane protein n=1 Tax=Kutzneria albida DSM 43870 TaxID=1449976 RepID=W5WGK5_9PSEU|nr:hypothetical protein [Kutzneria albida]AHH97294.1 putative membrane protein [Kutzneria albida DSM 43870]